MTQRFYLHDATTALGGSLPGGSTINPSDTPNLTATNAATNRTMDGTLGAAQTSVAITTSAVSTNQKNWFRRFLSPALGAQTYASGNLIAWSLGASELNANSDMFENGTLYIGQWRPSSGTLIADVIANAIDVSSVSTEPGTSQTVCTGSFTTLVGQTILDGDILVVEWWSSQSQAMATGYTNTVFYDGTTEGSITNVASYIDFGVNLTLSAGGAAAQVPYVNPMPPLLAQ